MIFFLIDIVGVVHDGKEPFPYSIQIINDLAKEKTVALVSNTPRPHELSLQVLRNRGLSSSIPVFTAGDQVRDVLERDYKGEKIHHVGADCNQDILQGLDVTSTLTLAHAKVVLLTQYVDDPQLLESFDACLKDIAERQLLVLCANADKTASVGDKLHYCAGTLAAKIEDFDGVVQYYGKPSCELFESIMQDMPTIQKNRILIIGDTLEKDIKWGINNEVDSLLVLTGTIDKDMRRMGESPMKALKKLCKDQKTRPTYRMNAMQ